MGITFVLQNAQLEVVKRGEKKVLLGSETAPEQLREKKMKLSEARPDIVHHCLLALLDTPLNKSGGLSVLIETSRNTLIEVNSRTRIPRLFTRFSGLVVQLMERRKIVASGTNEVLLRTVRGSAEKAVGKDSFRVGLSQGGKPLPEAIARIKEEVEKGREVVFYVSAISEGEDQFGDISERVSLSSFSLSAAACCSKMCHELERVLSIF
jgi:rRNA small subunit pseudouridine methyltransferase Nep1